MGMGGDSFVLESPSLDLEISRGDYFREDFWTLGQIGGIFHSKIEWFDSGGPPTKVHTTVNAAFQERGRLGALLKFSRDGHKSRGQAGRPFPRRGKRKDAVF